MGVKSLVHISIVFETIRQLINFSVLTSGGRLFIFLKKKELMALVLTDALYEEYEQEQSGVINTRLRPENVSIWDIINEESLENLKTSEGKQIVDILNLMGNNDEKHT
jgi:hypothetical protein